MPASQTERDAVLALVRERIVSYAASRIGKDAAEDLAQEALMLLDSKYGHLESPDDLVPLGVTIMKFKMQEFKRTAGVGRAAAMLPGLMDIPDGGPSPEGDARYRELRESILHAIEDLGGRCRELFLLKLEGYNFLEIKEKMGAASINTVYTWDSRCRQELHKLVAIAKGRV